MSDAFEELNEWLQQAPRTLGWGGLLAWDRTRVNSVLLQQYIAGFDNGHYLPRFTDLIYTSTLTAEYIYDYTLDCPRLSFENATIRDPKARLRMQVVGGLQLSLQQLTGDSARVYQIAAVDVLDGRSLYMNLALMQTSATTGSAGQVVLDLSKGADFDLTFARTAQERWLGGEYFRKQFEQLDDSQKVLVLGELGVPDGQSLKPQDFVITTHGKAGEPDKGAVLMLIRMNGDAHGHVPATDEDLRYLLEGGYSFTLLLGRHFLIHRLFVPACSRFGGDGSHFEPAAEDLPPGATHYLRAAQGQFQTYGANVETAFFLTVSLLRVALPLKSAECSFELSFTGADIQLHWRGVHHVPVFLQTWDDQKASVEGRIEFEFKRKLRFSLDRSDGRVTFWVGGETLNNCHFSLTSDGDIPGAKDKFRAEASSALQQDLIQRVDVAFARFRSELGEIPLDQMTGLLFQRREDLVFEKISFPRDLVLFGHLAPSLTTFSVRPVETVMGPSQTQLFTTWPPRLVSWRVDNLPGEDGPVGRIDALGFYTAPSAAQLPGAFLRVKVTATLDGYSSSALVTVLPGNITVNPMVMVHTAGKLNEGREMTAGTRGGGQLSWALAAGHSGGRLVPSSEADGDHTYFPGPVNPDLVYSIDEVRVTNPATLRVQTAYVLLLHKDVVVTVTARRGSGDTVQLQASMQGNDHPEMVREWAVMLGGGSVDRESGVFTPGASAHRFAIVTVKLHTEWEFAFNGFILLPLPYVELPAWEPPSEILPGPV